MLLTVAALVVEVVALRRRVAQLERAREAAFRHIDYLHWRADP
jgi:hypothetical protein